MKKGPLDIEWWKSPVTGGFDWDTLLFPIVFAVGIIAVGVFEIIRAIQ